MRDLSSASERLAMPTRAFSAAPSVPLLGMTSRRKLSRPSMALASPDWTRALATRLRRTLGLRLGMLLPTPE